MPTVQLESPPMLTLLPAQVAALGITQRHEAGATLTLTVSATVESTSAPGLRPEGDGFAMRVRLDALTIDNGA